MKRIRERYSLVGKPWLRWAAFAALGLTIWLVPLPLLSAPHGDQTFRIEAESYEYTPAVLRVNPMDRVTIELVSKDVVHGIYIDGYGLEVVADPGQTVSLSFLANRPGTFRFRCSVTCGALHPFMIGKIQVGPNLLLWRALGLAALAILVGVWSFRR